jgi:hypothetical protein
MADNNRPRRLAVVVNGRRVLEFEAGLTWEAIRIECIETHKGTVRAAERIGAEPSELPIMWLHEPPDPQDQLDWLIAHKAALSMLAISDDWDELIKDNPCCIEVIITDRPDGTQTVDRRACNE